jgi:glutamyl-tRNA reductase
LFFIDLAVPRDVDPRVGGLDGVFLYNIDDFERVVSETRQSRQRESELAERIVAEETTGWERWAETLSVTPLIVALRAHFGGMLRAELDKSMKTRLKHLGAEERAALETMVEAALNKMLHAPTALLRQVAVDHEYESWRADELGEALTQLFALDIAEVGEEAPEPRPAALEDDPSSPRATGTNGK